MRQRAGVQSRSKAVREIQAGLKRLSRGFRLLTREVLEEAARPGNGRGRRISPGRRIHGRYIGLIRNLPVRQKAKVRALRARRGVEAAIKMARVMRRSR